MLILHLEIKEAMFRRPPNARLVAAGNSSISDSPPIQAHNRYPLLVKCLCEPSEEEFITARDPGEAIFLFVCFF